MAVTPESNSWSDYVDKLKSKATEFQSAYDGISNANIDPVKHPELARERADLLDRGATLKDRVISILNTVESGYKTVREWVGLDGMQNMGFIPLIPIGVLIGAVGLLTKWLTDAAKFAQKVKLTKQLQAEGKSTEEATRIVAKYETQSSLFNIGRGLTLLPWAALGLGAWWLYRTRGNNHGRYR